MPDGKLRLNVGFDPAYLHDRKDGHLRYIFAADIGGAGDDPSAFCLLESRADPLMDENGRWSVGPTLRTVMWADLVRQPDSVALVDFMALTLQKLRLKVEPSPIYCTHDATGMGAPITDLLRQAKIRPNPIVMTAGNSVKRDHGRGGGTVSKTVMIERLSIDVHNGTLSFADGPMLEDLFEHIASVEIVQSAAGNVTFKQGGKGHHSDLMSAVALANVCDHEKLFTPVGGSVRKISGLI